MIIRQDFHKRDQLPPRMFLEQIMDMIVRVYCFLWDNKDKNDKVRLTWQELQFYHNKNAFRTCLRKLNLKGLISYEESDIGVVIELVGWEEFMNDQE